jgi:hypothetical protein
MAKGAIASQLMELENINDVIFQESYKKEEKTETFEPVEAPAEGEEKKE